MNDATGVEMHTTVVGLFDDPIDAEQALVSLKRTQRAASDVSVLANEAHLHDHLQDQNVLSKVVGGTVVAAVSGWLLGLAALVIPEQGSFLVAGPIGVALARAHPADAASDAPARSEGTPGRLATALLDFGFRQEEATYLEARIRAGSAVIAITSTGQDQIDASLRVLADHDAVFVGQAETPASVVESIEAFLMAPGGRSESDVIVADIVAPFYHVCSEDHSDSPAAGRCGAQVVDNDGHALGEIDDVLVERDQDDPTVNETVRYVVVGHGGVLGIARRRFAIPMSALNLNDDPVRVSRSKEALGEIPAYDSHSPLSRREELAIHTALGITPHWLSD